MNIFLEIESTEWNANRLLEIRYIKIGLIFTRWRGKRERSEPFSITPSTSCNGGF